MTSVTMRYHGPWQEREMWTHYTDYHHCHFCGDLVRGGWQPDGQRHYLSDCRPDLVRHEIGPLCTWHNTESVAYDCYAYQNRDTHRWTDQHVHFDDDGPM